MRPAALRFWGAFMTKHIKLYTPPRSPEEVAKRTDEIRARAPIPGGLVLLTTEEAAELAGLSPKILTKLRNADRGAPYYKLPKLVLYELDDILRFIERRRAMLQKLAGGP